jgi:hypothetical protein
MGRIGKIETILDGDIEAANVASQRHSAGLPKHGPVASKSGFEDVPQDGEDRCDGADRP